jgi:hypothetical protein
MSTIRSVREALSRYFASLSISHGIQNTTLGDLRIDWHIFRTISLPFLVCCVFFSFFIERRRRMDLISKWDFKSAFCYRSCNVLFFLAKNYSPTRNFYVFCRSNFSRQTAGKVWIEGDVSTFGLRRKLSWLPPIILAIIQNRCVM